MKALLQRWSVLFLLFVVLIVSGCAAHLDSFDSQHETVKSTDGSLIAYQSLGDGSSTIVFIHGWAGDHSVWGYQVEYFVKDHRVVVLDLAGRGKSNSKRSTYSIRAYGQDVAAVVNSLGVNAVVLVGHSMGGPIAVEAANILGDKVKGIVVVDNFHTPLFDVPERAKLAMLNNLKANYDEKFEGMVAPMFTCAASPELVQAVTAKMAMVDENVSTSSLYECILWNSREASGNLERYEGTIYNINAALNGDSTSPREDVSLIPDAGHFVQMVKPEEFNAALDSYLNQIN